MQVYIAEDGRQEGPYTIEHINSEATAGRIKPTDLAWIQGWTSWQPLSNVPGFLSASPPPLPPAGSPPPPPPPISRGDLPTQSPQQAALLEVFVGNNYKYYSRKWAEAEQKPSKNSWNWAAFFLSFWWTAYRKMYRYAGILFGVIVAETICESAFGLSGIISGAINLGIAIAYGTQGNRWYKLHAEENLREMAPTGASDDVTRARIARAGGTSPGAVIGFSVALFVVTFAIGFVAAIAHEQSSAGQSPRLEIGSRKDDSPKARTLAAWNAMEKVDYDTSSAHFPKPRLADPPTLEPGIRLFRIRAVLYSQIDVERVDAILTNHLGHRIDSSNQVVDLLESEYPDVVALIESLQSDVQPTREIVRTAAAVG